MGLVRGLDGQRRPSRSSQVGAAVGELGKGRGWGGVLAWRIGPIARRMAEKVLVMEKQSDGRYGSRTGWHSFPEGNSHRNAWHGPCCGPQEARGVARCWHWRRRASNPPASARSQYRSRPCSGEAGWGGQRTEFFTDLPKPAPLAAIHGRRRDPADHRPAAQIGQAAGTVEGSTAGLGCHGGMELG